MLLSIVLPCYNVERFITNTLKMLIEQIFACANKDEFEIIAINDGSGDKTGKIIFEFAEKYSFIKAISQENKGVSVARNVGLENASGKYIYFMDSDDTLLGGTIKFYAKKIKESECCQMFCFGYKAMMDGKDGKIYSYPKYDGNIFENLPLKQIFLSKKICFNICSCIYEREFLKRYSMEFTQDLKIGEDIEFILNAMKYVDKTYYSSRIGFVYQIRNDSAMQGYKTFSVNQFHSYEVRRDICFSKEYQADEIKRHSNFWLKNQLLSHLVAYLKSDFKDNIITEKFIHDLKYLKLPAINGALKNALAINLARLLPLRLILRVLK